MPTKRQPIGRGGRRRITPEAVRLFVRSEEPAPIYDACDDGDNCRSERPEQEHCAECREYLDAIVALHRMLGGKPWQTSPVDADGPEPPDYIAADAMKVADWRRAWELRCALEKAAEQ